MPIPTRRSSLAALAAPIAFASIAIAVSAAPLPAQRRSTADAFAGRWLVTFPSDAVRYVGDQPVPVGSETWIFAVVRTAGDSLVATFTPEGGPTVVDTLRGVVRDGRARLAFDPRLAIMRRLGDTGPVQSGTGPRIEGTLELGVRDEALTGWIERRVVLPGAMVGGNGRKDVTGRRLP